MTIFANFAYKIIYGEVYSYYLHGRNNRNEAGPGGLYAKALQFWSDSLGGAGDKKVCMQGGYLLLLSADRFF